MVSQLTSSTKQTSPNSTRDYWVIVGTGLALLLAAMGFGRYAYPMVLPSMQESLGVTYGPMGALGTVNLIGYLAFSLAGGILATRYGAKIVVTGSMVLVGLSMAGLGLVSSYWMAFVLMLLTGIGTAGVFTPMAGLGRTWSPPNLGGFTIGFLSTGAAAGIIIAALMVPAFLAAQPQDGWRHALVYMGIATLVLTIPGVVFLKERPRSDAAGAEPATSLGWGRVFRNRTIAGICLTYFLFGFFQIYATFFVAYLRRGLNLPTEVVGNIWLYWAILGFFFMAAWGLLSDRIGRKQAVALCMLPLVISVLMPVFWQDVPLLYVSAMLYGATFAGPMQIIVAAATDAVPRHLAAAAIGVVTAFFGLGQAVSPAIAGILADLTGSFYPGFILSAVVMVLSLVSFAIWPLDRRGEGLGARV